MTEETIPASALAYLLTIIVLGIACLIHFFINGRPLRALRKDDSQVSGWRLSFSNFILGSGFLFIVILTGQVIAAHMLATGSASGEIGKPEIIGGYVFHLSALLALFGLWQFYPRQFEPFNTCRLSWGAALPLGTYAFLASIPLVFTIAFFWQQILEFSGLPTDQQEVVGIFAGIESWRALAALIFLTVVIAPISEEFIFRGCLYRFLKSKTPYIFAAGLTSALFSFLHMNWLGLIPLFFLGVVLTYAYERTGNLKVPILLHAIFNANTVILLLLTREVV